MIDLIHEAPASPLRQRLIDDMNMRKSHARPSAIMFGMSRGSPLILGALPIPRR